MRHKSGRPIIHNAKKPKVDRKERSVLREVNQSATAFLRQNRVLGGNPFRFGSQFKPPEEPLRSVEPPKRAPTTPAPSVQSRSTMSREEILKRFNQERKKS